MNADPRYDPSWTCADCAATQTIALTKRQAAFPSLQPGAARTLCGSTADAARSHAMPPIDAALLAEWLAEEDLCFLEQDQDLLLADLTAADLIAALRQTSSHKAAQLIEALLVKLRNVRGDDREHAPPVSWLSTHWALWDLDAGGSPPYLRDAARRYLHRTTSEET